MRVEILYHPYPNILEEKINKRIIGKQVKDIKFIVNNTYYAMIIYEE